jgi:hypothetical protein
LLLLSSLFFNRNYSYDYDKDNDSNSNSNRVVIVVVVIIILIVMTRFQSGDYVCRCQRGRDMEDNSRETASPMAVAPRASKS